MSRIVRHRRLAVAAAVLGLVVPVWLAAGLRTLDPTTEIGVLEGPRAGPFPRLASGSWTLAPPGLAHLVRLPRDAQEIPLPGAEEAMLPARDGTRYGFRGHATVRVRPESWKAAAAAAGEGGGLRGALRSAIEVAAAGLDGGAARALGAGALARELEGRLRDELERRGLELRRLDLEGIDTLTVGSDATLPDPGTKLLVVGLDGADWAILDPLIRQGRMPNLAGLVQHGVRAKLLTLSPMLSPVVWTTVATGVEPNRHGILDFLVQAADGGRREPVTSRERRVPTVWQILNRAGISTGVVAWWATWPAEPVDGYLVTDRVAYQLFDYRSDPNDAEGKTWPPELYDEVVRSRIEAPSSVPWKRVATYLSGPPRDPNGFDADDTRRLEEFRTLLASGDGYVAIAKELSRRFSPRFEAVYLEGTDTVGHLFMRFRPPRLPGVDAARFETFRNVVDRYYEQADRYLGELLRDRGDDWTVVVLSDHGFSSDATRPQSTDSRIGHGAAAAWHRRFGVLVLSGRHVRHGVRLDEASVFDVAPTILALFGRPVPQTWPGRVLAPALDPAFLESNPVRLTADEPTLDRGAPARVAAAGSGASDALLHKLEGLGYVAGESKRSDSISTSNNTGVSLLAEGRYAEAERAFRDGLARDPNQPMLLVNLGLALRFQGRKEEARDVLLRVLDRPIATRLAGNHLAQMALEDGDLAEAERILRRVLRVEPDAAEIVTTLGTVREARGALDDARALYRRAADLDPNAAPPRNDLGNLARRAGRDADAERWYLAAIEADPYFMGAYNNLALVYQDRGELQKAIDLYARALERSPSNAVVMNNLASLYYARGELDEASRLWKRCVRASPDYASPYNNLAGIEIARRRFGEARPLLERALAIDPKYADARVNLAIVELAEGKPEAAIRQLEAARDSGERSTSLLNTLGDAYARAGRPDDAARAYRESLALDPSQNDIRTRMNGGGR